MSIYSIIERSMSAVKCYTHIDTINFNRFCCVLLKTKSKGNRNTCELTFVQIIKNFNFNKLFCKHVI